MHSLAIIWTTASLLHGVGDKLQVIQNTAMHVVMMMAAGKFEHTIRCYKNCTGR